MQCDDLTSDSSTSESFEYHALAASHAGCAVVSISLERRSSKTPGQFPGDESQGCYAHHRISITTRAISRSMSVGCASLLRCNSRSGRISRYVEINHKQKIDSNITGTAEQLLRI